MLYTSPNNDHPQHHTVSDVPVPATHTAKDTISLDKLGLATAFAKARKSYREGGIPIGAALIYHGSTSHGDAADAAVLGCAHNQRIQKSSPTLHAEIAALEDAGRQRAAVYRNSTMYTTLSPCSMCTGAILLYKIPRVVIGENTNWLGSEELLKRNGVEVIVLDDLECKEFMRQYIREKPEDWNEDIGE